MAKLSGNDEKAQCQRKKGTQLPALKKQQSC
jgi:hypothetical protein